jgi:hypothetical protein
MGADRIIDHLLGPDSDRRDDDGIRAAHADAGAIGVSDNPRTLRDAIDVALQR